MKILVVGGGGREHALAWKLAQEAEVICAPGNPGIAQDVETVPVSASDFPALVQLAKDRDIDLVVVGPEDPLVDGLADVMRQNGIFTFGPGKAAAQLEGSKAFSKEVMRKAGVPTAEFETFTDPQKARDYAFGRFAVGRQVVVKASGNALGKGVTVCDSVESAHDAIDQMMVAKVFGEAGATVVIEDRLRGPEFSLLTIVGDENFVSLPVAQDHKRAFDGDQGPNTGGMGTYSPVEWISESLVQETEEKVVRPVIEHLKSIGIPYRGVLFSGLMMDGDDVFCLEYNVRFGDPETQSVMMRLGGGLANALLQAASGQKIDAPEVRPGAALTVVVASGGYPGPVQKGLPIEISDLPKGAKLFHAGTADKGEGLVTNGGRVLAACASARSLSEAKDLAYEAVRCVRFEGATYRSDIGKSAETR